ncbi:hypothetical protein VIBNISO65_750021 [Vibrio nigripulchritudo SO65]|uniref:hypothetical protein n=1 Tax=Vibrio nigripulchritudo TaxID=28173 RepID=UPI0003B17D50|nr:hypothetical protein [Vibrio nigripulchritudo]CCN33643.1 hypothetical protein VIBNIAM115_1240021 [Vibrio nigripulchritudo AM115]CCN42011.1 hypothetical protein VIBNIFTn2_220022 [Vibrio nigripulchritudo FTn2]CCN67077.1 hypothetical protein VIBNIPon4_70021 [Vibrio nigripulchritudo POn4]CCN78786.1 hypothetical protein VIBNISO65_750021 [Vibrio nigripulchritudo SO65]
MKKICVFALTLLLSANALADISIPKNRVVCENNAAMQKFMKRKAVKKTTNLPEDCRVLEHKRKVEIVKAFPNKGYLLVETRLGDKLYVDKDAISR